MCELLIRVVSKTNAEDIYLDCQLTKRGDVIIIVDDNHPWQKEELSNPDWRILRFPGINVDKLSSLISPEVQDTGKESQILQRRAFKLDLDSQAFLDLVGDTWLNDYSRKVPTMSSEVDFEQVLALRAAKPVVEDPNVFEYESKGII